ncbi:hypothetical protein AQJ67_20420 [Streptomyces caeruleatus]|uniref:Uncharacterized protein n=1 Tax=Streptomyces caeruleatus TaxID=661399 RepID=A0A117RPY0_9ACTN|nr:hypothetical protein AQJ67_20420 [Streptomyces caeruleatus]
MTVAAYRHRAEHAELVLGLVDEAASTAQVGRLDLPGDVQDGRAGRERLDQGAGRVDGGGLVPDGYETQVPVDGFHERQVVDRHDAEDGVDAEGLQMGYEEFAPVVVLHGQAPQRMPRPTPPQTSMLVPVMYEARGESSATIA